MAVYNSTRSVKKAERLVKLRDYLYANASPTHAVKMAEILAYLADEGHEVDIKTVYSDIKVLETSFGLDIQYDGRQKGYLLKNPPFKSYDLRMIVNSIQAAKFITQQEADRLTDKVMLLTDKHTRPSLRRQTYIPNRVRTIDNVLMQNLDIIFEAIELKRKISYRCFQDTNKSRTSAGNATTYGSIIIADPVGLIWTGDGYVLFSSTKKEDGKSSYELVLLEEIDQVRIRTETRTVGPDALKLNKIFEKTFEIYEELAPVIRRTRLRISNDQISLVLKRFGNIASITPLDDNFSSVSLNVYLTADMYLWTLESGIQVLYPENADQKFREYFLDLLNGIRTIPPIFGDSRFEELINDYPDFMRMLQDSWF